jgi:hypothetical protein
MRCDNFNVCGGERDDDSNWDVARLRGWRSFRGDSPSGTIYDSTLCPRCSGSGRGRRSKSDLPNEQPLF